MSSLARSHAVRRDASSSASSGTTSKAVSIAPTGSRHGTTTSSIKVRTIRFSDAHPRAGCSTPPPGRPPHFQTPLRGCGNLLWPFQVLGDARLDLGDALQRLVPAPFQFFGDRAVVGVRRIVLSLRALRRIPGGLA